MYTRIDGIVNMLIQSLPPLKEINLSGWYRTWLPYFELSFLLKSDDSFTIHDHLL